MRIAMVSEHASPLAALGGVDAGGQNVYVAELSARMARLGHQVTVYTRRDDPALPERVPTDAGFDVVQVPAGPPAPVAKDDLMPYLGDFCRYLAGAWATEPPDLVHAHFWMSGLVSIAAATKLDIPVVQTFHALGVVKRRHQGDADTSPAGRIPAELFIGRSADSVVATCSDEMFELARMGVPGHHVSVVPCGVDVDRFGPDGPTVRRSARHRLLAVGRLVPRKGFDLAIAALSGLPDTELVIVGGTDRERLDDDPEARRLRGCAAANGVGDRVRLVGRVASADMPAWYRSADLVVCSPWYEPFGIVPLEAMACGVPVVATAVGGLIDTVVDGVTGLHVPPRKPDEMRAAIRALLDDPPRRAALGSAGHARVRGRYSWQRVAGEIASVYERLWGRTVPFGDAEGGNRTG